MLEAGDSAPDFAIGTRTLHALLANGPVVLFFFPKAFTPGWTREAGGFRREYQRFQAKGAEVVGVSADAQDQNDRFRQSLDLPFPLVGDADGAIGKAYGVRWPIVGIHRRASFVIGEDRRVREAFWSERDPEAHAAQACRVLGA